MGSPRRWLGRSQASAHPAHILTSSLILARVTHRRIAGSGPTQLWGAGWRLVPDLILGAHRLPLLPPLAWPGLALWGS